MYISIKQEVDLMNSAYKYIHNVWKKPKGALKPILKGRYMVWRSQNTIERIEKPTRLDRARSLGYKAKQGYVLVRVKIGKGGRRRTLYGRRGRKPSKTGLVHFTHTKGLQRIAEERAQKRFDNLNVLNSYMVGDDGVRKYFEVIMVDPYNPNISNDPRMSWISSPANRKRVLRGLTSAGKKARGLNY
jgi:large subunit ribosomal protein L15e